MGLAEIAKAKIWIRNPTVKRPFGPKPPREYDYCATRYNLHIDGSRGKKGYFYGYIFRSPAGRFVDAGHKGSLMLKGPSQAEAGGLNYGVTSALQIKFGLVDPRNIRPHSDCKPLVDHVNAKGVGGKSKDPYYIAAVESIVRQLGDERVKLTTSGKNKSAHSLVEAAKHAREPWKYLSTLNDLFAEKYWRRSKELAEAGSPVGSLCLSAEEKQKFVRQYRNLMKMLKEIFADSPDLVDELGLELNRRFKEKVLHAVDAQTLLDDAKEVQHFLELIYLNPQKSNPWKCDE